MDLSLSGGLRPQSRVGGWEKTETRKHRGGRGGPGGAGPWAWLQALSLPAAATLRAAPRGLEAVWLSGRGAAAAPAAVSWAAGIPPRPPDPLDHVETQHPAGECPDAQMLFRTPPAHPRLRDQPHPRPPPHHPSTVQQASPIFLALTATISIHLGHHFKFDGTCLAVTPVLQPHLVNPQMISYLNISDRFRFGMYLNISLCKNVLGNRIFGV